MLKRLLVNMWINAMSVNKENILAFIPDNPDAFILGLGCYDGEWTHCLGNK
jgi:hypothetical protein